MATLRKDCPGGAAFKEATSYVGMEAFMWYRNSLGIVCFM